MKESTMFKPFLPLFILLHSCVSAQPGSGKMTADETAIRKVLASQTAAWNRGDIDGFMIGYWENDSLMFIGKSGVTFGWNNNFFTPGSHPLSIMTVSGDQVTISFY